MNFSSQSIYSHQYFEHQVSRSKFRKLTRTLYLRDIRNFCTGKTIDFGCGIGELLKILPPGSIGFEINELVVDYCKSLGLNVEHYHPVTDDYQFRMIEGYSYTSFTMNHVLEHLENASAVIKKIFESCHQHGISRIVFTVPGYKGYKYDNTHQTYIDLNYLRNNGILESKYYQLKLSKFFPVNWGYFGRFFTHNELRLVFDSKK